jgi:Tfp pilus assembly protein PilF
MTLKGFIQECHKKEVFKMLSIYIVSSWVILQVLAVIADPLGLPEKSVTYLIITLLIGFPIYIYYVWKFRLLKYEIQQTEDPTTPYNKSAFQKMYFSSLFVISIIIGVSITFIIRNNFGDISLNKINSNDRIAVLEFTNNTNDEKLNIIGKITANWIIHGITEQEVGQVISPRIVEDYSSILKSQAGTVDLASLLKNYFKPGKVISGNFYKENDTLLLQGSIKDGPTDRTLNTFKTITCDPNSPLDCVEELKQKILGYLKIEGNNNYFERTPPKFEALQFNQMALDNFDNDKLHIEYLNKAIETDPNFFEPKTHRLAHYYNRGNYQIADSLRALLDNESNLTPRQQNILLFYESMLKGKNANAYKAHKEELKQTYLDLGTNMSNMTIALQLVNRPEDIHAIYNEIPMDGMVLENCTRCLYRYYMKGLADVELGKYEEVINTLQPITNTIEASYLKRPLISAYVKAKKLTELDNYLSDLALTASPNDINYLYNFAGIQLINSGSNEEASNYFNKVILNKEKGVDQTHLSQAYYFNEDYTNAQDLLELLYSNNPNNIDYTVKLAICYFNNRKFEEAKTQIEKLDSLRGDYQFGSVDYGWAQYYASIGDKDKALNYLLKAVAQGFNYTPYTYQNDPHFRTLKDSPEFNNRIMNYWKNRTQ